MKLRKVCIMVLLLVLAGQGIALAGEGRLPFQVVNRLRVEYDDNVTQIKEDPEASWKIVEEFELWFDVQGPQTFLGLRYRPSLVWWDNRPNDDFDVHHDFDLIINHKFSPRLSLSMKDTFRRAELPELIDRGDIVRDNNDFNYNALNVAGSVIMRPDLRLDPSARYILLRYDDEDVAEREDYDLYVAGLTLRKQVVQETSVAGDLRLEGIDYERSEIDRDSSSIRGGATLEQTFNPTCMGNLSAGYQYKDFSDSETDAQSSPYIEGTLTYLPTPVLRLSAGGGYTMYESGVFPYANQTRTRAFANLAYDITPRISWYLSASFTHAEYQSDDLPQDATFKDLPSKAVVDVPPEDMNKKLSEEYLSNLNDKSEDIYLISSRLTYKIAKSNWIELGWQYNNVKTELREDYDRNRIQAGWKIRL